MTTLAELYAAANERNALARRNEPLDRPVYPGTRGLPAGNQKWGDVASLAIQNAPGLGDVASLIEAYKLWKAGDTTGGLLSGIGALPLVAGMGAIKVYHGSPHNFPPVRELLMPDGTRLIQNLHESTALPAGAKVIKEYPMGKFDMSKIGTGEGAQAYGHGLYFAEEPEVAAQYAKNVKNAQSIGMPASYAGDLSSLVLEKGANGARDWLADQIERAAKYSGDSKMMKEKHEYFSSLLSLLQKDDTGHLYETSLEWPDPAREAADPLGPQHFLDWDKPLSEQGHDVRAVFEGLGIDDAYLRGAPVGPTVMRAMLEDDFRKAGIPGIRYLDQGSRGAGEGTANYVVFDDQIPRIVSRK